MAHKWLKRFVAVGLILSVLVQFSCWLLGFAGGWVAKFEYILGPAEVISFLGCGVFGATAIYLYNDFLKRKDS